MNNYVILEFCHHDFTTKEGTLNSNQVSKNI